MTYSPNKNIILIAGMHLTVQFFNSRANYWISELKVVFGSYSYHTKVIHSGKSIADAENMLWDFALWKVSMSS